MKTIRLSIIALMAFLLAAITPLHGQKLKPDAVPEEVKAVQGPRGKHRRGPRSKHR